MSNEEPNFPPKLADAIRAAYAHRLEVPARIEDALLARASAKFAQRRRMWRLVRWGSGAAAAIAACLVIALILLPRQPAAQRAQHKLEPSRSVTMVDAMLLARQLKEHRAIDPSWDFNRDGKIDQADVEAIAQASVSLEQPAAQAARPGLPNLASLGLPMPGISKPRAGTGHVAILHAPKEDPQ